MNLKGKPACAVKYGFGLYLINLCLGFTVRLLLKNMRQIHSIYSYYEDLLKAPSYIFFLVPKYLGTSYELSALGPRC